MIARNLTLTLLLVRRQRLPAQHDELVEDLQGNVLGLIAARLLQNRRHALPGIGMLLELREQRLCLLLLGVRVREVDVSIQPASTRIDSASVSKLSAQASSRQLLTSGPEPVYISPTTWSRASMSRSLLKSRMVCDGRQRSAASSLVVMGERHNDAHLHLGGCSLGSCCKGNPCRTRYLECLGVRAADTCNWASKPATLLGQPVRSNVLARCTPHLLIALFTEHLLMGVRRQSLLLQAKAVESSSGSGVRVDVCVRRMDGVDSSTCGRRSAVASEREYVVSRVRKGDAMTFLSFAVDAGP